MGDGDRSGGCAAGLAGNRPPFADMAELAETMPADGHSANRLIHRIVDTSAFGEP